MLSLGRRDEADHGGGDGKMLQCMHCVGSFCGEKGLLTCKPNPPWAEIISKKKA